MPKAKYNHAFDFAFEVITEKEPGDVTGEELKAALLHRINSMPISEFMEACGCFDTMGEND